MLAQRSGSTEDSMMTDASPWPRSSSYTTGSSDLSGRFGWQSTCFMSGGWASQAVSSGPADAEEEWGLTAQQRRNMRSRQQATRRRARQAGGEGGQSPVSLLQPAPFDIETDVSGTSHIEFSAADDPFTLAADTPHYERQTPVVAGRRIDLARLFPDVAFPDSPSVTFLDTEWSMNAVDRQSRQHRKILVTGCSKCSTAEGLRLVLERYGRIQRIQIWHDMPQQHSTGINRLCAIVTYEADAHADALLNTWPHLGGRVLRCRPATEDD